MVVRVDSYLFSPSQRLSLGQGGDLTCTMWQYRRSSRASFGIWRELTSEWGKSILWDSASSSIDLPGLGTGEFIMLPLPDSSSVVWISGLKVGLQFSSFLLSVFFFPLSSSQQGKVSMVGRLCFFSSWSTCVWEKFLLYLTVVGIFAGWWPY